MKESVRKVLQVIMAIGFFLGFAILMYPLFASTWNHYKDELTAEDYHTVVSERLRDESLTDEWEKAYAYNEALQPIIIPDSFIQAEEAKAQDTTYLSCMNIGEDGMMGYLSIPKIGENIPIYHTTSEETLQKGVGHLQGSSLPVGGTSTHAVIAGHRGLPGVALFTDLDQLTIGDEFYLHILDDILAYEVNQIVTVEPEDTEALSVVSGEDYVTLVTCTPYGVNTQRLLVRGHRVPYVEEHEQEQANNKIFSIHTNYIVWIVLGIALTALCMLLCRKILDKKEMKHKG